MKSLIIFLFTLSLACFGCDSDDSDSNNAGTAGDGGSAGAAGAEPAMGPGCYSGPPNHMCDCAIAEADCAAPQIWTDTCPCGDANNGGGTPEGGAAGEAPTGGEGNACYYPAQGHTCDCDATEAACAEGGGIWTDMCPCDGEGHEGHGHEGEGHEGEGHEGEGHEGEGHEGEGHEGEGHEGEGHGMGESSGSYGCYGILPNHMCDCEKTEAECSEAGGIWTDMCRSCS